MLTWLDGSHLKVADHFRFVKDVQIRILNYTCSYYKGTDQDDVEEFEQAIERQSGADQAYGEGSLQSDRTKQRLVYRAEKTGCYNQQLY